ncbi:hypothetical protein ACTA71_010438 [Dictyostelium dimigraforme]
MNVHEESNNENQESGSHGSNNSMDTVVNNSKDEEEYVRRLLEDDKEKLAIVRRVQLLEIRNIQLDKESKLRGCITHLNEIKSLSDTAKEMKSEIGQLKAELERVMVENDHLRADKQAKKEITFLDEEHSMGSEDKIKLVAKNEVRDNGSEYGAIQGKGKTGKNITNEEANKVKEVLKNHGPVKFFKELENVFQMHEVITLDNRIRVIKMKILDHCNYVDRISSNMNWKQIMELVANNDDSASLMPDAQKLLKANILKVLQEIKVPSPAENRNSNY